jgi:hypothetical protein
MRTKLLSLLTVCLIVVGLVACDVSGEQNYDFEEGETLSIEGSAEVAIPQGETSVTESYYSKGFTINKDYSWEVTGSGTVDSVYRQGEFIDISFSNATGNDTSTTTINVDDGEYQGTLEVKSFRQSN